MNCADVNASTGGGEALIQHPGIGMQLRISLETMHHGDKRNCSCCRMPTAETAARVQFPRVRDRANRSVSANNYFARILEATVSGCVTKLATQPALFRSINRDAV